MEENTELTVIDDEVLSGQDKGRFNVNIVLPTYEDMTDQRVLSSLRDVYKGFSFDANDDFGSRFTTMEQVASYVSSSIDDINSRQRAAKASSLLQRAASCGRCWCMSVVISKVLDASPYGSQAAEKIAANLNLTPGYVHKIAAISKKVSLTDSYLLGMRGISPTTLMDTICQIPDDAIRKGIITSFVNSIKDTADVRSITNAKRALINAITANKKANTAAITTSDPASGGSDIMVNEAYQQLMSACSRWQSMLKRPAKETEIEAFCAAASDFSISENVPEAEQHLAEIKDAAQRTKAVMQAVVNNLNDAMRELDSLAGVEVLHDEGTDIADGD